MSRVVKVFAFTMVLGFVLACGGTNPNPNVTPQAKIAHYGTDIAQGITTLQQTVTQVRAACLPCAPATDKITDIDQQAVNKAKDLDQALRAYDTASSLSVKNVSAAQVQANVAELTALLSDAFMVQIDNAMAAQVSQLISNVLALTATVSAEVAKGMSVTAGGF